MSRRMRGPRRRSGARRDRIASSWASASTMLVLTLAACAVGCGDVDATARAIGHGDADRGARAIRRYGCGTCHEIPHVGGATGHVGPSLAELGSRLYLAGRLANTPDHLIEWIRHPQAVEPGNVMPDMAVTERDARDIATYLYTLR